jgi:hypothetical protein
MEGVPIVVQGPVPCSILKPKRDGDASWMSQKIVTWASLYGWGRDKFVQIYINEFVVEKQEKVDGVAEGDYES